MSMATALKPVMRRLSKKAAALELAARRKARVALLAFAVYTMPGWLTGNHHQEICTKLEQVERGEIRRLMVFAPPRHGKSELTSKRFVGWCMGRKPDRQIIATSYSAELATDFGRAVRNMVRDQLYRNVFPDTQLAEDSTAAGRWHTNHGGIYVAAGVGGSITGRGADILLVDDPFKNREEADSEKVQETVYNWYTSTAFTRLMPGGAEVLILTRWNEKDLAGRLLEEQGAYDAESNPDGWHVVKMPAVANEDTENETALWPERYDLKALKRIKTSLPTRDWVSLYQQEPRAEQGTYIERVWFELRYDMPPAALYIYGASDFAVTEKKVDSKKDPDFTEHGIFGVGPDGQVYALDWWYGQTTPDKWVESEIALMKRWKPHTWFGEGGVIKNAIEPLLVRRMKEERVHVRLEWLTPLHDKAARARSFQGMASMRRWNFPKTPWADRVINQCVAFPGGKHDDGFDVNSIFGQALDQQRPGMLPPPNDDAPKKRDYNTRTSSDDDWKAA
jgi:predicted phage terminase large subunit-like protein